MRRDKGQLPPFMPVLKDTMKTAEERCNRPGCSSPAPADNAGGLAGKSQKVSSASPRIPVTPVTAFPHLHK